MPKIQIIMLTVSDDDSYLSDALKSGAEGYLLKNFRTEELLTVLSAAVNTPVNAQGRFK